MSRRYHTSLSNIFRLLELVSRSPTPIGTAEVGRALSLATTTAHRSLQTLEESGYIERYQSSTKFVLGVEAKRLLQQAFLQFGLKNVALPYLQRLSSSTNKTVMLISPLGWYAIQIASVTPPEALVTNIPARRINLLHESLGGKAILFSMSQAKLGQYARFCWKGDDKRSRLARETFLADFSKRQKIWNGIFLEDGPESRGTYSVSLALRDSQLKPIGAIEIHECESSEKQTRAISLDWMTTVQSIEEISQAHPDRVRNPFDHLDPDAIHFEHLGPH